MSDMLEQAIIDASALREAAIKNAESLVLEKFSGQIKDAITILLEQDELDPLADPAAAAGDMPPDPAMGGMPGLEEGAMEEEESSVMEHLPMAATQKDADESVNIPLDQLMEEIEKINEQMEEQTEVELAETDLYGLLESDEPLEEDDETLEEEENLEEDEDSLEEAIFDEIAESLKVEMGDPRSGWTGLPRKTIELAEEELLALEQDSEVREHRAAMRTAVHELEDVKESLENENKKLVGSLKEAKKAIYKLRDTAMLLKEKLDSTSLSNAKLIYTNKALTSDSLNERQKNKLVEAISNADNIEEAKVIFDTLQSTVGSTSRNSQPKSLGEAIERPSSMILSARTRRSERQKANPVYNRWQSLAGIEKDKN